MMALNRSQKNEVQGMRGVVGTGAPDRVLIELLKKHKWDSNSAVEEYFTAGYGDKYADAMTGL